MICRTCDTDKLENAFYFRKESGKYRPDCKACLAPKFSAYRQKNASRLKIWRHNHYLKNRVAIRKRNAAYVATHHDERKVYWRDYHARNAKDNNLNRKTRKILQMSDPVEADRIRQMFYASRRAHPEKANARQMVHYALKTGRLTKEPCASCHSKNSEAHHPDYSRPLEVVWYCRQHHAVVHKELRHLLSIAASDSSLGNGSKIPPTPTRTS